MHAAGGHRGLRRVVVALSVGAMSLVVGVAGARADAAEPVLAATQSSVVTNGDGSRTVTVSGQWAWPTRRSDCNLDKRAVGYAMNWNDPGQPGNLVTTLNHVAIAVGAQSATAYNPADNLVWPTQPGVASTDRQTWRGGCGTYSPSLGYNTGAWGPISHTYAPTYTGQIEVCVLTYDVHLQDNGGVATKDSEIVAGGSDHNGDNSAQGNAGSPLGNGCFSYTVVPWGSIGLVTLAVLLTAALGAFQLYRVRKHRRATAAAA